MQTYIQDGKRIDAVAPSGGVTAGVPILVGSLVGIAIGSAAIGETYELLLDGVALIQKTTSQAWAQGEPLYWDPATSKMTTTAGSLKKAGYAAEAALAAATTGKLLLRS